MKLFISKLYATILSFFYEGNVRFKYINSKGYWEFEIYYSHNWFEPEEILFRTKGLR